MVVMRASFGRIRLAAPLLALALTARVALAAPPQPPATPANDVASADAKRHFEAGVKLYAERVYASALAEFEESYRLAGKAVALKNVAQCHRDLKQFAEALDTYRQLLTLHVTDLKPKDRADVEKSVEELAKVVGTIEILAEPIGAEVSIDGKVLGVTPLKPVHVDVGNHEIKITKAGYQPFAKSVTLVAEQRAAVSTALVLEVTTGHVVVAEPGGLAVKVLVDEKEVGSAPWEGDLAPGTHTIQLVGDGLASEKRSVDVQVKGRLEISLGALATSGKIDVRVVPTSAELSLDGKLLGRGSYAGPVEPGQHTLEASAPGFQSQRTTITVERGKALPIVVTLIEERPVAPPIDGKNRHRTDDDADDRREAYRGTYGRLSITLPYPVAGSVGPTTMAPEAPGNPGTSARGDFFSGGASMRVGYNFDPIGLEFVSSFLFTKYTNALDWPSTNTTETMSFTSMGAFAGLGGRVTSREETVRVSAGLAIGAVFRWTKLGDAWAQSGSAVSSSSSNDVSDARIEPAIGFDAELMIGSTPGTRFVLGVESWVEFLGKTTVSFDPRKLGTRVLPAGPYTLSTATAFYVGPHVGLQFGR
jgi:CRISPR/Cas system-associated exonuclease Cas4 (RecB family)